MLVHLHLLSQTDPPMAVVVGPRLPQGVYATSPAAENVTEPASTGDLDGPITTPASGPSGAGGGGPMSTSGASGYGPLVQIQANSGMGWVEVNPTAPTGFAPSFSLPGGPNWPILSIVRHLDVTGILDPEQSSMTFQIPVTPGTQFLGLSVHQAESEPGGETAFLQQMDLVNATGSPLEQFGPNWGSTSIAPQAAMMSFHTASVAGRLLVQVTAADSSSATGSGTTTAASRPADWTVSFILDVQRQEAQSASQDAGSVSSVQGTLGTVIVAPAQQPGILLNSTTWSELADDDGGAATIGQAATAVLASTSLAPDPAPEPYESFNFRVPTGPLASRSAGPLGPILASADSDPTEPVDRHERALWQDALGLGASEDLETTAWRNDFADQEASTFPASPRGTSELADSAGPVITVPGRTGFPLEVTSQGRGQQDQLASLWATLPSAAALENPVPASAQAEISLRAVPLATAAETRSTSDPLECPDYVKVAYGLVLGLCLTSGPLFPDLIASLPRRIPKWLVVLRASAARSISPASKPGRVLGIPAWLRGFLGCAVTRSGGAVGREPQ